MKIVSKVKRKNNQKNEYHIVKYIYGIEIYVDDAVQNVIKAVFGKEDLKLKIPMNILWKRLSINYDIFTLLYEF